MTHAALLASLRGLRCFGPELAVQDRIEELLDAAEIAYAREANLSATDRIDFLLGAPLVGVGIEVKVDGGLADLTRQVHRYLAHDDLRSIVVVSTRSRHTGLPPELRGKRIDVVHLIGACL